MKTAVSTLSTERQQVSQTTESRRWSFHPVLECVVLYDWRAAGAQYAAQIDEDVPIAYLIPIEDRITMPDSTLSSNR